ncbi:FG-GAP-like repeat-containing protein [Polaromonas sp. A23]|uniref:FG-GAP-like repeat-containing protein n=1 Tax=Polaromonas sp. A23 TaxID=1944133 RepID=UPI000986FB0A|nr:FG-GAP-like repeat-containing protein [Polaromonas sp. A23]OOG39666.1 hypothetical protein B0B52_13565 [Polaromonas sp. A23]
MKNRYSRILAGVALSLSAALMTGSVLAQTTVAGTTPGQFSVNESGAATYSIPIQVPPGVAGMQPQLFLEYNSQSGNGLLGMGWGISGLSAITRCPRTRATDGVMGGVNFDANDRFCLDGQRLILSTGTVYGAAGTEYRTEIESFNKITANGTAGNGPASFTVKTKSGLTVEYGNTPDSAIEAIKASGSSATWPNTSIRVWAQNKVTDVKGNYLMVSYDEDTLNGAYYPLRMDYTGNSTSVPALVPSASVQFVASAVARLDVKTGYQAGAMVKSVKRIGNIKTFSGATLVKDYRLAYVAQASATDTSTVEALTECAGDSICMPRLNVQWGRSVVSFGPTMASGYWCGGPVQFADFNGDGLADRFCHETNNTNHVSLSNGDGTFGPTVASGYWCGGPVQFADFNGDGLADRFCHETNNTNHVSLSNGDGTFGPTVASGYWCGGPVQFADFNGDGLADRFCHETNNTNHVSLSSGGRLFVSTLSSEVGLTRTLAIAHTPLTTPTVYTKDTAPNASVYPKVNLQMPMYVVSSVSTSNGVGGINTVQYSYGGLKAEQGTGRGSLGFRWMKSKSVANNIESYTEFNQNHPFTGTVARNETRLAGSGNAGLLKRTTNTYAQSPGSAGTSVFVYPSQSVEESWDLSGTPYPSSSTSYVYGQNPQYGDPTQITVSNSEGSSKTTANEYWPVDSNNWILGRLKKATVTSVKP